MKTARKKRFVRHRENTSEIALYPYEVAAQLLVSEPEVYKLMALGPERGGIRAMCLGDPNSARPRKVIARADFSSWVRFKRGLLSKEQYLRELAGGGSKGHDKSETPYNRVTRLLSELGDELLRGPFTDYESITESQLRALAHRAAGVAGSLSRAVEGALSKA